MTTARQRRPKGQSPDSGAADYRADLWRMADALRGSMDAAEYKHVVLGLIFLKYISDAFEEVHTRLEAERDQGADPEDRDEYLAQDVFWVPAEARWPSIQAHARQSTIGQVMDAAMAALERDNLALKDILPKEYGRDALDKQRLGQVVDLVSNIKVGGTEAQATDVLGRVYEYFLEQFALAEGRRVLHTPAPWSGCWWRCWNHIRGGSTTHAADPRACSSSRWSSSAPTPRATATAAGHGETFPSTGRSPTTRPGGWQK